MDLFEEYKKLWENLNESFPLGITERECVRKLEHWRSSRTNVDFDPNIIPYIEVSKYHNNRNTILFVGMNPSGADIPSYNKYNKNSSPVFKYTDESPYYKTMQNFANECYEEKDKVFAELDVFGIVQADQKVIEKDFQDNPQYYKGMFELFLKGMKELNPEVIVVANAFVRKILLREKPFDNKYDDFYGEYIKPTKNEDFGGYDIEIGGSVFKIYFSCMLSGGHLDSGNRDNLIWLIRNYLKNR